MSWFFVGAAVVGAISAISAGDSARKQAHFQADVSKQRAQVAADQANVNEDAQRRRAAMALGQQRAAIIQAGGGTDGTNAELAKESGTNAEIDALNIRYQGKLGVMSNTADASAATFAGDNANTAGYLNAGAAALSSYGGYTRSKARTPPYGG